MKLSHLPQKILLQIKRILYLMLLVQAVATVTALPFLAWWGLPLSLMSVFGNMFFAPILTLFLFFSSLLFITEILSVPNLPICLALEYITIAWSYLLELGQKSWLFPISWHTALVFGTCVTTCSIFAFKKKLISPRSALLVISALLFVLPQNYLNLLHASPGKFVAQKSKGKLTIKPTTDGQVSVYDNSFFGRCSDPAKAACFDIRPLLAQKYGTFNVETLHLKRTSIRTILGAAAMCELCNVSKVSFPTPKPGQYKDKKPQKTFTDAINKLKEAALLNNTLLKNR